MALGPSLASVEPVLYVHTFTLRVVRHRIVSAATSLMFVIEAAAKLALVLGKAVLGDGHSFLRCPADESFASLARRLALGWLG